MNEFEEFQRDPKATMARAAKKQAETYEEMAWGVLVMAVCLGVAAWMIVGALMCRC